MIHTTLGGGVGGTRRLSRELKFSRSSYSSKSDEDLQVVKNQPAEKGLWHKDGPCQLSSRYIQNFGKQHGLPATSKVISQKWQCKSFSTKEVVTS